MNELKAFVDQQIAEFRGFQDRQKTLRREFEACCLRGLGELQSLLSDLGPNNEWPEGMDEEFDRIQERHIHELGITEKRIPR